jgi:hypothetical protein
MVEILDLGQANVTEDPLTRGHPGSPPAARNTTRQEDGPACRPPDGLRLSKNPASSENPRGEGGGFHLLRTAPRER